MKSWKKVKLGSILTESKIVSEKPNTDKRIRVKLNVLGVEKRPITKDKKGATKYYTRKAGQFIYGKQNLHKGAFGIVPKDLDGYESSSDIPAFDVNNSCYPEWVFYFFKKGKFYLKLEKLAKGIGSKRINTKQVFGLDIYLPSKEEQRKILDEIEKSEVKNQELVNEIQFQENNLIKLRQSILQDAIQGKLSKDWRIQNPDTESAVDLLKKIDKNKKLLIAEKKIKKGKKFLSIKKDEIPFEIPKSWTWERLGKLTNPSKSISYGVLIPGSNVTNGVPLIRVSDLELAGTGKLPEKSISNEISLKYKKTIIEGGEILITVVGGTIGKTVIADIEWKDANIARAIARIKIHDFLDNKYFYLTLISPYIQFLFTNASRTIGQPTLNIRFIEKTLVPVPPKKEQIVITEKVDQLMANCEAIEHEIKTSEEAAEKLIESILMKLLGDENNVLVNKEVLKKIEEVPSRKIKYNSKTTLMDLVKLLQENGPLHAEDLWGMSKFPNDIDAFYAELKKQIELMKTIKESAKKGYLELV